MQIQTRLQVTLDWSPALFEMERRADRIGRITSNIAGQQKSPSGIAPVAAAPIATGSIPFSRDVELSSEWLSGIMS